MDRYGKYGISEDAGSAAKSGGIFYYVLLFLVAIFLLLVLLNFLDKTDVFKNLFSDSVDKPAVLKHQSIELLPSEVTENPKTQTSEPVILQAVEEIKKAVPVDENTLASVADDLPQNSNSDTMQGVSSTTVFGSMEGITAKGFTVNDVMWIHQQVPDSELATPSMVSFALANGKALRVMSDTLEAKLIRNLLADNAPTKPLVLDKIWFRRNSDKLERQSYAQINNIVEIIKTYPERKLRLRGHTDSSGDAAYNQSLSLKRVNKIMVNFIKKGVLADRIEIEGVGEEESLVENNTSANRRKNRRVDISVIK